MGSQRMTATTARRQAFASDSRVQTWLACGVSSAQRNAPSSRYSL